MNTLHAPSCSIIIPVFNQLPYTQKCLESIYATTSFERAEVIVINNGSNDGTARYLNEEREKHSFLQVLSFPTNKGFATACNEGALKSKAEILLFLNNDTQVTAGWFDTLLSVFHQCPLISAVGPKLLNFDGTLNHGGYVFNRTLSIFYPIYEKSPGNSSFVSKRRTFDALLGACLAVRSKDFFSVRGFAEYGLEDIDLCLKLREQGKEILYCPESIVYHHGSVTLRNTPVESLPLRDEQSFRTRWSFESLKEDIEYYREDGMKLQYLEKGGFMVTREEPRLSEQVIKEETKKEEVVPHFLFKDSPVNKTYSQ